MSYELLWVPFHSYHYYSLLFDVFRSLWNKYRHHQMFLVWVLVAVHKQATHMSMSDSFSK